MTIDELKRKTDAPVVMTDQDGFVTYVNDAFRRDLRWEPDDLVGRPITWIISKEFHDAHHLGLSRFLVTERSTVLDRPLRLTVVTKDGTELIAEHFIIAEKQQGRWVFGAVIRPLDGP